MKKFMLPAAVALALLVGLAIGFIAGRITMERKWADPFMVVTAKNHERSSVKDKNPAQNPDPTPAVGARIFRALPLARMRMEANKLTAKDPLKVTLTSFGNGEDGGELHLMMQSDETCVIKEFSGVAYAFDSHGIPAKANRAGEPYLLFTATLTGAEFKPIAAKGKYIHSQKVAHTYNASLGVAHVDSYTCDNGKVWRRPS